MKQVPVPFQDLLTLLAKLPETDLQSQNAGGDGLMNGSFSHSEQGIKSWMRRASVDNFAKVAEIHVCLLASAYKGLTSSQDIKVFLDESSTGKTLLNQLCVEKGVGLQVLDLGAEMPYDLCLDDPERDQNIWSDKDCMATIAFGMEATAKNADLLCLADFAPGNESASYALLCSLSWLEQSELTSLPLDMQRQISKLLESVPTDYHPLIKLRLLAGREIAALVGAIVAARLRHIPLLLDGVGALAAYAVLHMINPLYVDHCLFSAFPDQTSIHAASNKEISAIFNPSLMLGPGCASVLAVSLVSAVMQ